MKTNRIMTILVLVLAVGFLTADMFAGGPLYVCTAGTAYKWGSGGANIPFNPDQGPLGPLTHSQAVTQVTSAFGAWGSVSSSTASYSNAGQLPVDVDINNFGPWLNPSSPDGYSPIVFDDTGQIFNLLFGANSGVLGFAGPEFASGCTITEGQAFLNGAAIGNLQELTDISVHEFGHYTNLAHTVVNGQIVLGDTSGPTPFNTFTIGSLVNLIETMYPFYFGTAAGTSTPHADDIAMLSTLYPASNFFSTTGSITGTIFRRNRRRNGVNVIARNINNPFADAVSAISGDFATSNNNNQPFVGVYTLNGLTPGATYAVFIDRLLQGGFSTTPYNFSPEEFWNGASEAGNNSDNPSQFVGITAIANTQFTGVNILINR